MVKHIKDEVESKPAMKKIKAWDVISSFVRALLVLYFAETFNLFDTTIFFNYYILIYIIFTTFGKIYEKTDNDISLYKLLKPDMIGAFVFASMKWLIYS